jgi:hypothetical protein
VVGPEEFHGGDEILHANKIVSSRPWLVGPEMKTETILYYYATVKFTWLPDMRCLKADFFLPLRSCFAAIANYLSSVLGSWHASLEGTCAINVGD